MKWAILISIVLILGCNFLALEYAEYYTYGLALLVFMNSFLLSRKMKFPKALGLTLVFVVAYIATKYLINYFGNYRIVVSSGEELPIIIQLITAATEFFIGLIVSAIIIVTSQLIRKPNFDATNLEESIGQIGS